MCAVAAIPYIIAAVGAVVAGNAQRQQAEYQADVNRYTARVQENQATATRNAGVEAENEQRRATAELLSRQRAQLGAANVDITSGSPLQLQQDTVTLGEADALRIRSNYEAQALSLSQQSELSTSQAGAMDIAGRNAMTGSLLSAAGSLAGGYDAASGGGGTVSSAWYKPNSAANSGVVMGGRGSTTFEPLR